MLLDQKLILFDGDLNSAGITSGEVLGDVIDISNLGVEAMDLSMYVLFKTAAVTATASSFAAVSATDAVITTPVISDQTPTRNYATSNAAAGTLHRLRLPQSTGLPGSQVSPQERYLACWIVATTTAHLAGELATVFLAKDSELPISLGEVT
ncbi:MAG: hypothetical protein ACYTF7_11070 [Planctomycetota bacterium]|jgi:hypothetical protein